MTEHRVVIDRDDLPPVKRNNGGFSAWDKVWRWRCLDCDRKQPWTPRRYKAITWGKRHGVVVRHREGS